MTSIKRPSPQQFEKLEPSFRITAAVAAALFFVRSSEAAVIDWSSTAATNVWTADANWIGGAAPANSLTLDIARFNQVNYASQPDAGTISVNGIQIGDATTASAALTITGTSLSIGVSGIKMFNNAGDATISSPIALGAPQSWTNDSDNLLRLSGGVSNGGNQLVVNGSGNTFVSGLINGGGGIEKGGVGTLVLTGANTYTGLTTINSGILQIGDNDNVLSVGAGNYEVAAGAHLVFARNATPNGLAFVNQSIAGAGDVTFTDQSTGYFTFRGNYFGTLSYTGHTIVDYDAPVAATTWFQRALWLEKDNLLPHATVLDLLSGKVFLRGNTGVGETVSGLTGVAGTFITTDQNEFQKFTTDVPSGATYSFDGVIGIDASSIPIEGLNVGNITFIKKGAGTQILNGANTYVGGTIVNDGTLVARGPLPEFGAIESNGGTLALDYSTQNASKIPDTSLVTLGGGALSIIPNGSADTTQALNGVTLTRGGSAVNVDKNGAAQNATLNLQTIVREPGATLDVTYGGVGSGTASVLVDNTNTNGILGAWAIFAGSDWATNSSNAAGAAVAALASANYTADLWAPGNHTNVTMSSAPGSNPATATLRFSTPSPTTVTLTGSGTIETGGILVAPSTGSNTSSITGGSLQPGDGGELIVHQQNPSSSLNISSTIIDNGVNSTGLTKSGPGVLILSDNNTYSGPTTLSGGVIVAGKIAPSFEPSSIGASFGGSDNLIFNGGGVLQYMGATVETDLGFTVNGEGGVIEVAAPDAQLSFLGPVGGAGDFAKNGPGSLVLGTTSFYTGNTSINDGILQIGNNDGDTALNSGDFSVAAGSQLIFSRNVDNVAFLTQSISGEGDVVFQGQSFGYFTFRGNYTGSLSYTGRTIVNYDPDAGGTWFERTLWLEKDDSLRMRRCSSSSLERSTSGQTSAMVKQLAV